jgi:hypothetical protein
MFRLSRPLRASLIGSVRDPASHEDGKRAPATAWGKQVGRFGGIANECVGVFAGARGAVGLIAAVGEGFRTKRKSGLRGRSV